MKSDGAAAQDAGRVQCLSLDSARKKEATLIRIWTEEARAMALKNSPDGEQLHLQKKNALYNSNNEGPVGHTSRQARKHTNSMPKANK
jgi:hypothetical protein